MPGGDGAQALPPGVSALQTLHVRPLRLISRVVSSALVRGSTQSLPERHDQKFVCVRIAPPLSNADASIRESVNRTGSNGGGDLIAPPLPTKSMIYSPFVAQQRVLGVRLGDECFTDP